MIILADADWDGHHIATLLLTFIYRHMPQLITSGAVYLAQPPLFRIDIGKETYWALDDAHRDRLLKQHGNGRAKPEITRFKGLGEMMPKVLWETTLDPRTRRLLRVDIADQIVTDRVINELMGKERRRGSASSWNGRRKRKSSTSDAAMAFHSLRARLLVIQSALVVGLTVVTLAFVSVRANRAIEDRFSGDLARSRDSIAAALGERYQRVDLVAQLVASVPKLKNLLTNTDARSESGSG